MQERFGTMSKPKGSNKIWFARRVVRTWLMYSQGYQVERIAYELEVTPRMVYYYLNAWFKNKDYFIRIAKDAGSLTLLDEASLPPDKKVFTAKELVDHYQSKMEGSVLGSRPITDSSGGRKKLS